VNRDPLRHCVWGFFHEKERAIGAARENETDLNEAGYYPLAVVAEVQPGLVNLPVNLWWFEFEGKRYRSINAPEWTLRYGWLGFPRVQRHLPEAAAPDGESGGKS